MSSALAALSLRRALPRSFLIASLVLAAAVVATSDPTALTPMTLGGGAALRREGAWTVLSLALLPWIVHRASVAIGRWRDGEIDWLAKSPAPRLALIAASASGLASAVLATLIGIAAAAELAASRAGPDRGASERRISAAPLAGGAILDGRAPARWTVTAPAGAERARVDLAYVPLDVFADVRMVARDPRSGSERSSRTRLSARESVAVELPIDSAEIEIELSREAGGGIALLAEPRIDWIGSAPSARMASLSLLAHAALAALAAAALALGLGAWLSPLVATASVVSLALLGSLVGSRAAALWPTVTFAEALDLAGRGIVPEAPGAGPSLASAAAAAVGLALAWLGTRRWRMRA